MLGDTPLSLGMLGQTHTGSAGLHGAVLSLSGHLAVIIYLVELKRSERLVLILVLNLLGLGVDLLLSLLSTAAKTEHQVESALLLNVVITEGAAILELLASENETLLIRRNPLLVLDLCLHIIDTIGRLHLEGDGLTRQSLDEDLYHVQRSKQKRNTREDAVKEPEKTRQDTATSSESQEKSKRKVSRH